ncbi:MAG TPA: FAD-dependent oxidoreductase [Microbacteriaceae bacterium]
MTGAMRVVLVGNGPVGARFVEELLPSVRSGSIELTVVGAEPVDAYNRVLLADYAAGRITQEALSITDTVVAVAAGVRFQVGTRVTGIDRQAHTVALSTGAYLHYDRLVIATGARANLPTLDGIMRASPADRAATDTPLPPGIVALRDLADADRIRAAVTAGERIVVLGAGVLGLELALAAAGQGADVVIVHHGSHPMPRNLDRAGGTVLARNLRDAGIRIVAHSRAEGIDVRTNDQGLACFDALLCADGKRVPGDLLVLSCGVSARVELAERAQLPTAAGVLVDRRLRSWGDADVCAIGDCAHVSADPNATHGIPLGLIGPGWRQAQWLAAQLSAEAAGAADPEPLPDERPSVVMLKADDIDVVSAGTVDIDVWEPPENVAVAQWADAEHGRYVKLVTRAGVLEGVVCVGMPRTGAELTLLFERGSELPADRSVLLRYDGPDDAPTPAADGFDADATVCWCNGVSAGRIRDSALAGCCTVADVGADTRAGTGCGGCTGRITELLARFASAPVGG